MVRITPKTLSELLDMVNKVRGRAGLIPIFFRKEIHSLKLQNRWIYRLYLFPKGGETELEALNGKLTARELYFYLAGMLDGTNFGMKIAAKELSTKTQEVF